MNSLTEKIGNLLSIEPRDNAIFSAYSRKCTSISNFNVSDEDIRSFFEGGLEHLKLSNKSNYQDVIDRLENAMSPEEMIAICREANVRLFQTEQDRLLRNFKAHRPDILLKAKAQLERASDRLISVHREAKSIWKDRGTHNLYLTRYFLIGISKSGKTIRAPLIMFNVDFKHDKKSEEIVFVKRHAEPVLNEKLIQFFIQEEGERNSLIKEFRNTYDVRELVNKINKFFGYSINNTCPKSFEFVEMKKTQIQDNYNELVLEDGISFGTYEPAGGKLKEDLENLVRSKEHEAIFNVETYHDPEELRLQEMFWEPLVQISNLDFYQRCAVRSAVESNTIIHGPPGTGKSEVIVNIIANILTQDKNVVISSEKKAALDVLEKRLKSLKMFMLNFLNDNKEGFYSRINLLGEYLGKTWETRVMDKHVDNPKASKTYVNNKNLIDKFINDVKASYDFENHKYKNIDFGAFINEVEKLWGSYKNFESIINANAIHKLEENKAELDLKTGDYVQLLNDFCSYIDEYGLADQEAYNQFFKRVLFLKAIVDEFKLNLNDAKTLGYLERRANYLSAFLQAYPTYDEILKNKTNLFYEITNTVSDAMNDIAGVVHPTFFANKKHMFNNIHEFFEAIGENPKLTKYYFDKFVYQNIKPWLKNKTNIFYKRKLNKKDKQIFEHLQKLNALQIKNIHNFEELFINQECFNPAVVSYHYTRKLFVPKYIEFVTKRFYLIPFVFYKLQNILNLTADKLDKTKELIEIYKYFMIQFPHLVNFDSFNNRIDNLSKVDWSTLDQEIEKFVAIKLANRLSKLTTEEKELISNAIRVAKLKRRPGIYEYINKYNSILLKLFPIWVCRPDQVATYVPLGRNFFDYGIFDEASQMFLERAYPLLYRAKVKIVAGDQKQLRPSSYFTSRNNIDYDDEQEIESSVSLEDFDAEESLLDRAVLSSWNQTILQNHYRSLHKDLIQFSSEYIYDNKLNYASANLAESKDLGIEVVNANGYFIDRINDQEADAVINLLETNFNKYGSILIVCSNDKQKEHIIRKIFNIENTTLRDKYSESWERGSLEIINIENVQGNEADLVILSLCYGPSDDSGKFAMRFGPLTAEGGKNRLNVAVTRARRKMIVVKSFNGLQIVPSSTNPNLNTFKDYINFLDLIHQRQYNRKPMENYADTIDITDLQKDVLDKLLPKIKEANLDYKFNYIIGNKTIDLAIMNPITQQVVLGIQIDEWKAHQSKESIINNINDQMFLQARHYSIYRVIESEWFMHHKLIVETISNLIDEKVKETIEVTDEPMDELIETFGNPDALKTFELDTSEFENEVSQPIHVTAEEETDPVFESGLEQSVYEHLRPHIDKLNLRLVTQYQVYGKRIDMAIINPLNKRVLLGIEVDGSRYHTTREQISNDFERQKFLEEQGYTIYRVSQTAWNWNKVSVINDVLAALKNTSSNYQDAVAGKTRTLNLS